MKSTAVYIRRKNPQEKNLKKLKFWDATCYFIIISFLCIIMFLSIFSLEQFEMNSVSGSWLVIFFVFIVGEYIFWIGMMYHSYKQKKYFWLISIIILGTLFPILFYVYHLRPELKKGSEVYT